MSDHSYSIVPKVSSYPGRQAKAQEILEWLWAENIVERELSDCVLGKTKGYAVAAGAARVVEFPDDLPLDLGVNGLEIISERQVFHTGEDFIDELICPNCQEDIALEDWSLEAWTNKLSDNLICPQCGEASDIQTYTFDPEWGFSDLGFTFWNWPELNDSFIQAFKEKLGSDIAVVFMHI